MVSVACFRVRVSVMFHLMFVYNIYFFVRYWLLSAQLYGNCCPLGWPYVLIVFILFLIFIYFPFLRAGPVWCRSRPIRVFGDQCISCVLIAFLTKPKPPHFKVVPGHLR